MKGESDKIKSMAGKKLLVADDSLTIQKVIRLALSNEGYEIQTVSSGNEALQQIPLFRPDVVLIDIALPEHSAFDVKRTINQQSQQNGFKNPKFILMSSAFEKVDEIQAEEVQFQERLTKPFDPAHLRKVLTTTLNTPFRETPPPPPRTDSPPPPPPFPPPPPQLSTLDIDIDTAVEAKTLTEQTLRMSQMNDFQWSIKEPWGTTPPLPPAPEEASESEFASVDIPKMEEMIQISDIPPLPSQDVPNFQMPQIPESQFDSSTIEPLIKKEIEQLLKKYSEKLLPEIAERIVKEEIQKIISD